MRGTTERPEVSVRDAVVWSLIYPGLGHRLAGRGMDGLARGALFTMAMGLALLLGLAGGQGAALTALMLLFLLAAFGAYALSAFEAARLAHGFDLIVPSRTLLWILVGMTFASIGALAVSVMSATRR